MTKTSPRGVRSPWVNLPTQLGPEPRRGSRWQAAASSGVDTDSKIDQKKSVLRRGSRQERSGYPTQRDGPLFLPAPHTPRDVPAPPAPAVPIAAPGLAGRGAAKPGGNAERRSSGFHFAQRLGQVASGRICVPRLVSAARKRARAHGPSEERLPWRQQLCHGARQIAPLLNYTRYLKIST